jgi:hypothetical protein
MKRKDYITENEAIKHIDTVVQAVLDELTPLGTYTIKELCRYLVQIPGELWSQVPTLDAYLEELLANNTYHFVLLYKGITEYNRVGEEIVQNGLMPHLKQLFGYKLGNFMALSCYWARKIPDESLWEKLNKDTEAIEEFASMIGRGDYVWYFVVSMVPHEILSKFPRDVMIDIIHDLEANGLRSYLNAYIDLYHDEQDLYYDEQDWKAFTEKLKTFTNILGRKDPPLYNDMWELYKKESGMQ